MQIVTSRIKLYPIILLKNQQQLLIDHHQLQVLHGEFELQLKLQCELTLIHCR